MDDFHTPVYETIFHVCAWIVTALAAYFLHKKKWLLVAVTCVLLLCFGQGLPLFTTATLPLRITYNYVNMTGKAAMLVCTMALPALLAARRRSAGILAIFGILMDEAQAFIVSGINYILNFNDFSFRSLPMPGFLLTALLLLVGALFFINTQYERIVSHNLLEQIKANQKQNKSPDDIISTLALTPREKTVVSLLLKGDSMKIISSKLNISYFTVNTHITNLYRKLNIQSKGELFSLFMVGGELADAE